jgi:hypothetical protein
MRKLIANHRLLGRPGSKWSPGWAIGAWFVPPGAIYAVPWLIFKELWRGSDPANVPNDPNWRQRAVSPIVHVWWVLYGFVPILGAIAGSAGLANFRTLTKSSAKTDTEKWYDLAKSTNHWFAVQLAVAVLAVAATATYGVLVLNLTRRQRALTGEG